MGCHCLLPGDLLDPGIKPGSPALQAVSLPSKPSRKPQSVFSYINEMSFGTSKDEGWWPGESVLLGSLYLGESLSMWSVRQE